MLSCNDFDMIFTQICWQTVQTAIRVFSCTHSWYNMLKLKLSRSFNLDWNFELQVLRENGYVFKLSHSNIFIYAFMGVNPPREEIVLVTANSCLYKTSFWNSLIIYKTSFWNSLIIYRSKQTLSKEVCFETMVQKT